MADTDKMYTSVAAEKKKMQLLKGELDALDGSKADKATVAAGSYNKVTVNSQGIVTAGENPTTLAGHGIQDAYTKTEVNGLVDTPHQNYVTVQATDQTTAATDVLPASGQAADTIYRVSNWDGSANNGAGAFDVTVYSEYAWDDVSNPNKYVFLCVKTQIGEVFDISVYNNNAKYADLAAALNGGANIPQSLQKGGMRIQFVQSSDNNYVQYRLIPSSWSIDVDNWQSMNVDNAPAMGSKNLITSGAVYSAMLGVEKVVIIATANKGNVGDDAEIVVKVDNNVIATGTGSLTVAIAYDVNYTVECSRVYDYLTPAAQTFTAGLSVRNVTCAYTYIERDTITLDQTETDEESMITGDVQGDVIKAIRAASHLYLGTPLQDGSEFTCQLSDIDGTKYFDGTNAALDGTEGDQWMKLPVFWWKRTAIGTAAEDGSHDSYSFSFAIAGEPDPSWHKWEGAKNLLGAKEMTVINGVGHSISGGKSTGSLTKAQFETSAAARSAGSTCVTWEWQWMMCTLFYAWYGRMNSQKQCGTGSNSYARTLGTKDALGMTDTTNSNGNSDNTKFWGIENLWGCKAEWIGRVTSNNYVLTILDMNTGQSRTVSGFIRCVGTGGWTSRMKITEDMDYIPVAKSGTDTTSYCDWVNSNSVSRVVYRSYNYARPGGGVACVSSDAAPSGTSADIGSRLAFNGVITEAESVAAYKAALPVGQ